MSPAPVPPVTMFSVFPVKLGVPVATGVADDVARGALHAAATSSVARSGAKMRAAFLIRTSPKTRGVYGDDERSDYDVRGLLSRSARRASAADSLRLSSSVSAWSGGTGTGCPRWS